MQANKTYSELERSSSRVFDVTSLRDRFLGFVFGAALSSLLGLLDGVLTRRCSIGGRRVWMGGRELLLEEMLPRDCVLKAWAKEGRDCGTCVAMLAWLTAMDVDSCNFRDDDDGEGRRIGVGDVVGGEEDDFDVVEQWNVGCSSPRAGSSRRRLIKRNSESNASFRVIAVRSSTLETPFIYILCQPMKIKPHGALHSYVCFTLTKPVTMKQDPSVLLRNTTTLSAHIWLSDASLIPDL